MAWIYLAASAASHSHLVSGLEQSPIVIETDLLNLSCSKEYMKGVSTARLSGMTCKRSGERCSRQLILLREASPARTLAVQEMVLAWEAAAQDYFSRSCAWPKKSS